MVLVTIYSLLSLWWHLGVNRNIQGTSGSAHAFSKQMPFFWLYFHQQIAYFLQDSLELLVWSPKYVTSHKKVHSGHVHERSWDGIQPTCFSGCWSSCYWSLQFGMLSPWGFTLQLETGFLLHADNLPFTETHKKTFLWSFHFKNQQLEHNARNSGVVKVCKLRLMKSVAKICVWDFYGSLGPIPLYLKDI